MTDDFNLYENNNSQLSHDTEYSPEDDIETTQKMPCDIVKIVFWIIFYKVEYNLNFPNCTLFIMVILAMGCLSF
jgi:hypothetical protein